MWVKCACEWDSFLLFVVKVVVLVVHGLTVRGVCCCEYWSGITACLKELAHFLCFFREISVAARKTSQSKELRVWDGVLDAYVC